MTDLLDRIPRPAQITAIVVIVLCCLCACGIIGFNALRARGILPGAASESVEQPAGQEEFAGPTDTLLPEATATDSSTATPTHDLDATRESIFAAYTERALSETGTPEETGTPGTETPTAAATAENQVTLTLPAQICSPAYPTVCIPPPPPDLDCGDVPFRNFTVLAPDPHEFDPDENGVGCES